MATEDLSSNTSGSEPQNVLWEHGDDNTDSTSISIHSVDTSAAIQTPSSSQPPTPGLTSVMLTMELSSRESGIFFSKSSCTHIPRRRAGRTRKRAKFHGNQHTQKRIIDSSSDDPSIID